jgi:hypothetical protein
VYTGKSGPGLFVGSCTGRAVVDELVGAATATPLFVLVFWKLGQSAKAVVTLIPSARTLASATVKILLSVSLFMAKSFLFFSQCFLFLRSFV